MSWETEKKVAKVLWYIFNFLWNNSLTSLYFIFTYNNIILIFYGDIGVSSIYIDVKQGLVKVTSNIEPTKVVEAIKKIGRKAELLSYEKDPPVAQEKLNHIFTKIHNNHIADSDSNIDDDDNDEDDNNDDLRDENCE